MDSVKLIPREIREAVWPVARFLSNEEQAKYKEAVKTFNSETARKNLDFSSNLFKIVLLNQIGIPTATIQELVDARDLGLLKRFYADSSEVVLRSAGDSYQQNDLLAKKLGRKIGKRSTRPYENPFILKGFKTKESEDYDYALTLVPADNFQFIEAPDFHHKNHNRKFSRINPDYSIEFDDNGDKTLYTRDNGLSGASISDNGSLFSNWSSLANSNSDGRVVAVDAEGVAPKNFEAYVSQLTQIRETQIAEVEKRYQEVCAVLKGKK